MASFQIGSEIAAPLSLTAPFPVDARNVANSVEQVLTEYPSSCRYLGLKIWIENENKLYVFSKHILSDGTESTGLTDDDFQPFESGGKSVVVDPVLSLTSTNAIQNKVVSAQFKLKQDKLVLGENLDKEIEEDSDNPISSSAVYKAVRGLKGELLYRGYYKNYASLSEITGVVPNDFVTVENDETKDGKKTKYIYGSLDDGTLGWIFDGYLGSTEVQINDDGISNSEVWSSKKTNEEIMKQHQPYQAGIPLVAGEMYIESNALYRCLVDVSSDENLAFALLPDGTMELVIGNGDIKQCEYDEVSETLILNKLTMDEITYNESTQVLNIFQT